MSKLMNIFLLMIASLVKISDLYRLDNTISCRNEITGEPVDWFTTYKLPRLKLLYQPLFVNPYLPFGTAYTFITSQDEEWKLSSLSINDTSSILAKTLEPIYSNDYEDSNLNFGYVLYNDQVEPSSSKKGHTKGVILFNDETVVWIIHSIPHFPPKVATKSYYINPGQCVYGQSAICMTFKFSEIEKIGQQFLYSYPNIYDYFISDSLKSQYSKTLDYLMEAINGKHVTSPPWYNLNMFYTLNGEKLLSIAKFTNYNDDLYSGIVAESLNSSLLTETWNNGKDTLPSNCSSNIPFHVNNIEMLKFDFIDLSFSVHNDHSKWAVTTTSKYEYYSNFDSPKIACIGDINRQKEQFQRGGGTMCFLDNKIVWSLYSSLVSEIQPCN